MNECFLELLKFLRRRNNRINIYIGVRMSAGLQEPTVAGQRNIEVLGEKVNAHLPYYSTLKSSGIFSVCCTKANGHWPFHQIFTLTLQLTFSFSVCILTFHKALSHQSHCNTAAACAHYVMLSKIHWKPFWLATQLYPQNDCTQPRW